MKCLINNKSYNKYICYIEQKIVLKNLPNSHINSTSNVNFTSNTISNIISKRKHYPIIQRANSEYLSFGAHFSKKSILKELTLDKGLFSVRNTLIPLSLMKKRNVNFHLVLFNLILKEFLSLESIFYLNKISKEKFLFEEDNDFKLVLS